MDVVLIALVELLELIAETVHDSFDWLIAGSI